MDDNNQTGGDTPLDTGNDDNVPDDGDNIAMNTPDDDEPEKDVNAAAGTTDGLIGSRRIRTFLIGGLLATYCFLAMIWNFQLASLFGKLSAGFLAFSYVLIGLGLLVMFIASVAAIVLHCLNKEGGIETMVGWCLLGGSICLLTGTLFLIFKSRLAYGTSGGFLIAIGEGVLAGLTGIFLALDVIKDFMAKEERRLFYNLLVLAVVSGCCFIGYSALADFYRKNLGFGGGAFATIAIGYVVILGCSVTYCVLNFCDCITCNCDDNCIVRLLLAGGLLAGGVLTAIGYWSAIRGGSWTYGIGYTILLCGLCVVWALDMGIVDTVKEGNKNTDDSEPQNA